MIILAFKNHDSFVTNEYARQCQFEVNSACKET